NSLCAGNPLGNKSSLLILCPFHIVDVELFDLTLLIPHEFFTSSKIDTRVRTKARLGLFLAVVQFINFGPFGPRIVRLTRVGGARQNFKLCEALALMPHGGAHAVRAGVPAADDYHMLIGRRDVVAVLMA